MQDFVIIGGGRAGLFSSIFAPKNAKKLILEKTDKLGTKVLLSGGERANLTNIDIEATRDYFGQNKKAMISILRKFSQYDTISFFARFGIKTIEEDRGRIILESGNSRELLDFLTKKSKGNNTQIKTNFEVIDIIKKEDFFEIIGKSNEKIQSKKVLIRAGGQSFSQTGTTGDSYNFASKFGLKLAIPYRALSAFATKKNLSDISGVSLDLSMTLFDKLKNKNIYIEFGPFLFTHFGVSGPIVFNSSVSIGEYLNKLNLKEEEFEKYMLDNIALKLEFNLEKTPKRIIQFFELNPEKLEIILDLQNWRSWKEAKLTGGGVLLDELSNNLESKKNSGLYFAGEALDLSGKTGGFNLQLAWSTGYIVGTSI
ncbi:MAG: aminoacetone oxidase family FAD-binding enzyme [Candidatus Gracilibacteria bacterium]|nr:aminoacetone oxidase family FAD-binding enzyme [Candidatus Gracilibacteria bacterium]